MPAPVALDPGRSVVEQLRERVAALEGGPARVPVPVHPGLSGSVSLHAGGTYGVDSASLALALAAGASQAGEWVGFAGWGDLGVEAAADLGIALERTVLVPDPGEHWLEVTAALVDVLKVVVLRPPVDAGGLAPRAAGVLESRLRTRSAVLVVWGDWPRCEARYSLEESSWQGLGVGPGGHGGLRSRRTRLVVRRGTTPPLRTDLAFPGAAAGPERLARLQADRDGRDDRAPVLEALG